MWSVPRRKCRPPPPPAVASALRDRCSALQKEFPVAPRLVAAFGELQSRGLGVCLSSPTAAAGALCPGRGRTWGCTQPEIPAFPVGFPRASLSRSARTRSGRRLGQGAGALRGCSPATPTGTQPRGARGGRLRPSKAGVSWAQAWPRGARSAPRGAPAPCPAGGGTSAPSHASAGGKGRAPPLCLTPDFWLGE